MRQGVHDGSTTTTDVSPEFKAEAVRLVRTSTDALSKIARDLGIQPGTLGVWVDATRPPAADPLTSDERTDWRS